jgi:Domain of unknown function (DUF4333)
MLAGMGRHALIPAAVAAVLLGGCSHTIDSDKAERTIARLVATEVGSAVASVDCPSGKTAHEGDTFLCRVTGKDGSAADATVTETDDTGTVRVTARFLPTDETERSLAAQLTHRRRAPVGVDCQDIIVARKNVTFDCVTSTSGKKGRIRARQVDASGRVRYRPVKGS